MNPGADNPQAIVDGLFALYEAHGAADYLGEPVSQLEHMWQAAALAEAEGCEDEVVLAAFFHDLGHLCAHRTGGPLMDGFGAVDHERLGADYLRARGFSARLAGLVESHVLAKRYLTYKHPEPALALARQPGHAGLPGRGDECCRGRGVRTESRRGPHRANAAVGRPGQG